MTQNDDKTDHLFCSKSQKILSSNSMYADNQRKRLIMTDKTKLAAADVLAGRGHELETLRACLQTAAAGSGNAVVISGEAGIGKKTLVQNVAREAEKSDAVFVSTRFHARHGYQPYKPFADLVEQLDHSQAGAASRVQPENSLQGNGPDGGVVDKNRLLFAIQEEHDVAQHQLLSSILTAATRKLHIIEFRDCHLAPLTAWRFIHYLAESVSEHKILFIISLRQDGRSGQNAQPQVYGDVLQRMNREGLYKKIDLKRFNEADIRDFLLQTFQHKDFSHQFVNWLCEVSNGIPAQLSKYIEIALKDGIIYQQDNVWFHREDYRHDSIVKQLSDSHNLLAALQAIDNLPAESRSQLQYAALMKGPLNCSVLASITGKSRIQVIKDACRLTEVRILSQRNSNSFEFTQAALRQIFQEQIAREKLPGMHAEIARAIECHPDIDTIEKTYLLAFHYNHSDDHLLAFKYLWQAGEFAIENFAFLEAREFLTKALSITEQADARTGDSGTRQVLFWLAWVDRILGNWQDSIASYAKCLDACDEDDHKLKNQIMLQQGLTYFRLNDWQNAKACLEHCLANREHLSRFDLAMANGGLGNIHFELADYALSCQYYEAAIAVGSELSAKSLLANVYNNMGAIENIRGQRMRAIALYSKSVPIFKNMSDGLGLARVYNNIGMTYADDQQWEEANEFYGQSLQVSDVMGLVPMKSITFLNRALVLAKLGAYDEAREYNIKAHHLLQRIEDELGLAEYHKIEGIIARDTGNAEQASQHLQVALGKFETMHNKLGCAETEYELAILAKSMGQSEAADAWFRKALKHYSDIGNTEKTTSIKKMLLPDQTDRAGSSSESPDQEAN
jgi:tetratricopeptide (TPR) repeat protein